MTYYEEDLDLDIFGKDEDISLTKKGKLRKRRPKESQIYFTQDTEDAIIEYLSCTNQVERNRIYNERIEYAFYKLAENIIHTFKFYYTDTDTIEELKHEVITVLLEKLHLFNHSKSINDRLYKIIVKEHKEHYEKGSFQIYTNNAISITQQQIDNFIAGLNVSEMCYEQISKLTPPKAYSYFGTIVKRYLIIYNKQNYAKLQEKADIEELDEDKSHLHESMDAIDELHSPNIFINQYIKYIDKHMYILFPKQQDAQTADAIVELFRKRDTLEIFNKKALYIYIREMNDVSTPQITKIIKKLDTIRTKLYNEYYKHGYISGI